MHVTARRFTLRAAASFIGALAALLLLEGILRLLPVHESLHKLPVNDENPMMRFRPNRQFTFSTGWNFSLVNEVRVNDHGFISDFPYDRDATSPLLAVIGDSYVEAAMVRFSDTCAGSLARALAPAGRVYAFGVNASALSQYVAYAEYVRETFRPDGLVIVVTDNDFDESLLNDNSLPGYHYFVETDGQLVLRRKDFAPNLPRELARKSALARYIALNVRGATGGGRLTPMPDGRKLLLAGTPVATDPERMSGSKRVVDTFLRMLHGMAGLEPERIAFVVDGLRSHLYHDETLAIAEGTYFDIMRRYFMGKARGAGYEVLDMQPEFVRHYEAHGQRFDWPHDYHWNALAHSLCSAAVARSRLLSLAFGDTGAARERNTPARGA